VVSASESVPREGFPAMHSDVTPPRRDVMAAARRPGAGEDPGPSGAERLAALGWDAGRDADLRAAAEPALPPGRVSRIDRGVITVLSAAGSSRVTAPRGVALAVGDWLTIRAGTTSQDLPVVGELLPRRSTFRRLAEESGAREQVVAANIDTVLLVTALDGQLSVRHLERYVALAWGSGAVPVVVITKADLAPPERVADWSARMAGAAPGVAVHVVSAVAGHGLDALTPYLAPGRTVALLGLSGAGKSTLVNVLAGAEVLATAAVRADGQGRHTTTHRELVILPGGGLIIDTPGMRALSVWGATAGLHLAFADVEALAGACAFDTCSHTGEAGCALEHAVAEGRLAADRLASWTRLRAQQPPLDRHADRLAVLARKQRKATARAARRGRHRADGPDDPVVSDVDATADRPPTVSSPNPATTSGITPTRSLTP